MQPRAQLAFSHTPAKNVCTWSQGGDLLPCSASTTTTTLRKPALGSCEGLQPASHATCDYKYSLSSCHTLMTAEAGFGSQEQKPVLDKVAPAI